MGKFALFIYWFIKSAIATLLFFTLVWFILWVITGVAFSQDVVPVIDAPLSRARDSYASTQPTTLPEHVNLMNDLRAMEMASMEMAPTSCSEQVTHLETRIDKLLLIIQQLTRPGGMEQ